MIKEVFRPFLNERYPIKNDSEKNEQKRFDGPFRAIGALQLVFHFFSPSRK